MQKFRRWLRSFVGISTAQANGLLVLLPLLALLIFSEPAWRWYRGRYLSPAESGTAALDALIARWEEVAPAPKPKPASTHEVMPRERFAFDPNHTGADSLRRLGIPEYLARRIIHYREKGGRFRIKRDLLRIYGFDSLLYQTVAPLIRLPEKVSAENNFSAEKRKPAERLHFDLNTADTAQLKRIYGIGNVLSQRIVAYRDGLGGFVKSDQLYEVYGLDSAVVKRLAEVSYIAEAFRPRRLNVNTVDERGLSVHPYLSGSVARAIVAYRFQHGEFHRTDDLRNIPIIKEATIRKIEPYLIFNE